MFLLHRKSRKQHLLPNHPFRLVAGTPTAMSAERLVDWNSWQVDILHHGPDDCQTRRLCRKSVNLIGALPHIAKEAFNRIGRANVTMHDRWKRIKRQQMLFIFHQAAHCFSVALAILGECSLPNSAGHLLSSLASRSLPVLLPPLCARDEEEHSSRCAVCGPHAAFVVLLGKARRRLKAVPHARRSRSDPFVLPHDGADLVRGSSIHLCRAWRTRSSCQHVFVPLQVYAQRG